MWGGSQNSTTIFGSITKFYHPLYLGGGCQATIPQSVYRYFPWNPRGGWGVALWHTWGVSSVELQHVCLANQSWCIAHNKGLFTANLASVVLDSSAGFCITLLVLWRAHHLWAVTPLIWGNLDLPGQAGQWESPRGLALLHISHTDQHVTW